MKTILPSYRDQLNKKCIDIRVESRILQDKDVLVGTLKPVA